MALSTLTSSLKHGQRLGLVNIRGLVIATSILLLVLPPQTDAGCPFQNPFWFLDRLFEGEFTDCFHWDHQARGGDHCRPIFLDPLHYVFTRPTVVTVVDSQGKMVPDRVRVSWGRLENFKCVDYFQIEYYEKDDRVCMKNSPKSTKKLISPLFILSDGYC